MDVNNSIMEVQKFFCFFFIAAFNEVMILLGIYLEIPLERNKEISLKSRLSQTLVSYDKHDGFLALAYPSLASMSVGTVAWVKGTHYPIKQQELSEVHLKVRARKLSKKKSLLSNEGEMFRCHSDQDIFIPQSKLRNPLESSHRRGGHLISSVFRGGSYLTYRCQNHLRSLL